MKKCLWTAILTLLLVITWGGEGFTQAKKEIVVNSTHYWSGVSKAFPIGPEQTIFHGEIWGVRINDGGAEPFHEASVHIATVSFRTKDYFGFRGYETWVDKDGDKVVWELLDTPPGAPSSPARLISGTGKYTGWQGTMDYTLKFPKPFPEGTRRGICREQVKFIIPQ